MADTEKDYRNTVFLPQTDFPMRGGLPKKEPEILKQWQKNDLYGTLRVQSKGRETFILHDGPPYANGDIHIGHAMQKILKDVIIKTQQMQGRDANFVPGWDCHGLPIEWKIEEKYRKKKKNKDDVDPVEFRRECRDFASEWIDVQREQFKRLGVVGDWDNPYTTMAYAAEAKIVQEILAVTKTGALYQGSKPVMWSPVEKTALAEAEVEYQDHTSTQIDVAFDILEAPDILKDVQIMIWTTTPWTIPGNRAICYGSEIDYITVKVGDRKFALAETLLEAVKERTGWEDLEIGHRFKGHILEGLKCAHPWRGADLAQGYYDFDVPLFAGDHVTTDAGTGFVHTAPGHGQEDFEIATLKHGLAVPHTVAEDGRYFDHVPLVTGHHVYKVADHVCALLGDHLIAKHSLTHSYPHSWRSKAPLIYRNTPQWFISMDKTGLRERALRAIATEIDWHPAQSRNRIEAMVRDRPDWVISRQRSWGVPITLFVHKETRDILIDEAVNQRIIQAVKTGGADAWIATPKQDFLGASHNPDDYDQVFDVIDVWFDSGSTHSFVLEDRPDLSWPADLYMEGTDQHRGWFQSSLLEACLTRGSAPYKQVLTHGFTMDGQGRKMSKSLGNTVNPQKIVDQYGADILRLWVVSNDYFTDHRISDQILKTQVDAYRKIRNTLRYLLGSLSGFDQNEMVAYQDMPELERVMLNRLHELDGFIRKKSDVFDFNPVFQALNQFIISDLSAFYFDIRKDALYCDASGSLRRRATRTVMDAIFHHLVRWLAPFLSFTMEEVWQARFGQDAPSVHLELWPSVPDSWQDPALAEKWSIIRRLRRVVMGALEIDRREKKIGSSLQASVTVYADNPAYKAALEGQNLAEISITSSAILTDKPAPEGAFTAEGIEDLKVITALAAGEKCARCWTVLEEVSANGELCNRCREAVA